MRMLVFFDLPVETAEDRGNYRKFRKMLIRSGFIMMQESVYCKLLINTSAADLEAENIRKRRPTKGIVQMMLITEKQFADIEYITGEFRTEILNTDERMVIV